MTREYRRPVQRRLAAALRRIRNRFGRRREQPPPAGVREPRRPRPTLPAAAVALAEPRTARTRRIRLISRRPDGDG
jgi:hypothetical protein